MNGSPVVLHNARLIDGTGAPPVADGALVVDGPRIGWCGPARHLPDDPALRGAVRVDLGGRTVCPGSSTSMCTSRCPVRPATR
ncbi:hypothetical protein ACFQ60_06145 [Streptomyces zhihengii]